MLLKRLLDLALPEQAYVISQDTRPRLIAINENTKITVLPWREFLDRLWQGKIA